MRALLLFVASLILPLSAVGAVLAGDQAPAPAAKTHPLLELLQGELDYSMKHLATTDGAKPYYLSYTITDVARVTISAQLGALENDDQNRDRILDVDLRVGDYALDSTHQIRGRAGGGRGLDRLFGGGTATVSLDDNEAAIKHALWRATDRAFQSAVDRYQQVQTNLKTMVEEEQKSEDFSREKAVVDSEPDVSLRLDRKTWAERVREVSRRGARPSAPLQLERRRDRLGGESLPGHERRHAAQDRTRTLACHRLGRHQGRRWHGAQPVVHLRRHQRGSLAGSGRDPHRFPET
jgi:hypothetical protein